MRKVFIGILLVALCLSGCAYNKQTLLKIRGKKVDVPLGPLEGIKGEGLSGYLYRAVSIAFPAKNAMKTFPDLPKDDSENMTTPEEDIDVQ